MASLIGASLIVTSLIGASLIGASLIGAFLIVASLIGASLIGASLTGAFLIGASLMGLSNGQTACLTFCHASVDTHTAHFLESAACRESAMVQAASHYGMTASWLPLLSYHDKVATKRDLHVLRWHEILLLQVR